MTTTDLITFLGGPVAGAAAAKLWQWWTERDKATRDAAAARANAVLARDTDASAALVAELKESRAASERRADAAAASRAEVAAALVASTHSQDGVAREIGALGVNVRNGSDAIVAKIDDLADTVDERLTRLESALAAITRGRAS